MEAVSEKTRYNNGQDKKGKKNTKVELNLGKNGGFFILLGGALVTALLSSAFRKQRNSREKDENNQGNPPPATATAEAKDEQKNNISDGEDPAGDDEDPVRKGLQFILSDPSSLIQDHLSKEDETMEKDGSVLKIQANEEQDSPENGCHQEIISNDSSIPGSATSSEQEYSSQPFYTNPLFEQANLLKEEGTLHTEDFRVAKADETIMETAIGEEVKEMADVLPDETEEMEYSEKNFSPEIEVDLCDGQKQRNDENRGVDDKKDTNSEEVTSHKENGNTNEAASGNDEEETKKYIQFVDEKKLCDDDIATVKQNPILPSNDKEGDETDDGDECGYDNKCDYGDGDDDISEESSEGGGAISSDEVAIWPAEPVETALMELKEPNLKEETDYINSKTINTSKHQNSPRKLVFLDNLVTFSFQSKPRILAGTFTLLIAFSCFWYFELPFLKPSLVVIAAMFLSKVVVLAV